MPALPLLLFSLLFFCLFPSRSMAVEFGPFPSQLKWQTTTSDQNQSLHYSSKITARVGGWLLDVEGWTSPYAHVLLESTQGNVHAHTMSDLNGSFIFRNLLVPQVPGDLCFYSTDTINLSTAPLCIAPPPLTKAATVSGVILPPSLQISQNLVLQGEDSQVTGLTVPNSQIQAYLFESEDNWLLEIIKTVIPPQISPSLSLLKPLLPVLTVKNCYARTIPQLSVRTDEKGQFSFNLPSHKNTLWRFYLGSQTPIGLSPRSATLEFRTLSWWQWFIYQLIHLLIKLLLSVLGILHQPLTLILLELLLALYLIWLAFLKRPPSNPPQRKTTVTS